MVSRNEASDALEALLCLPEKAAGGSICDGRYHDLMQAQLTRLTRSCWGKKVINHLTIQIR
jgi:hypothetical protein